MIITLRQKFYAAAIIAAVVIALFGISLLLWKRNVAKLERRAAAIEHRSKQYEADARDAEQRAEREAGRVEYLEKQISEIRDLAAKQDEHLKTLDADTRTARGRADRARGIRAIDTTTSQLCAKLESLGHRCGQ